MIPCDELARISKVQEPATVEDIALAEQALGYTFPVDYKHLLLCSDGLYVEDGYKSVYLHTVGALQERNETYQVAEYAPRGWVLIGDDGGGKGIFLDCSSLEGTIYYLGMGSLLREDAEVVAENFRVWVNNGLRLPADSHDGYPDWVDVWLLRLPIGGPKDLLRLKTELGLQMPIVELYRCLERLPCRVLRNVTFWHYARICARYNANDACLGLSEVDQPDRPIEIPLV